MKIYPKGSKAWAEPVNVNIASTNDLIKKYEEGFSGVYLDPDERDRFTQIAIETGGYSQVEDAAQSYGWYGSFAEQLVIPFVHVMELMPGVWPGPAQQRGDCVSHSDKNAKLGTLVGEVVAGQPDEITGKLERIPDVPSLGLAQGGLSTEVSYWYRGSNGDGWYCGAAANVSIKSAGAVVRKNYPEIGLDLTKYSSSLAGKWGRTRPPENIAKELRNNLIRTAARASSFEGLRDNLGQGRFISSCGSEGFSKTRDKYGVSRRSGSWAHAMGYIAADDRKEIVKMYGGPLVLVLNSWGPSWNSGPRDIFDSAKFVPQHKKDLWIALDIVNPATGNIMIPKGSFWTVYSSIKSRDCYVYAGMNGWEVQKITNWGTDLWG
jgi:hypothetical protein